MHFIPRAWFFAVAALLLLGPFAHAQNTNSSPGRDQGTPPTTVQQSDKVQNAQANTLQMETEILSTIHAINQMEIKAGEIARNRGTTAQIRQYGDRVARDHTIADQNVMQLSKARGIKIVEPPPAANADQQQKMQQQMAALTELETLHGSDFDQKYLSWMEDGHKEAIEMLSQSVDKLPNSQVKRLVGNMVPVLIQHYQIGSNLTIDRTVQRAGGGE